MFEASRQGDIGSANNDPPSHNDYSAGCFPAGNEGGQNVEREPSGLDKEVPLVVPDAVLIREFLLKQTRPRSAAGTAPAEAKESEPLEPMQVGNSPGNHNNQLDQNMDLSGDKRVGCSETPVPWAADTDFSLSLIHI